MVRVFLDGILHSATQAINTAHQLNALFEEDLAKINALGRIKLPQVTVPLLSPALGMSAPTARSCLSILAKKGILKEITGMQRDKIYVYKNYLDVLEKGTDPCGASL